MSNRRKPRKPHLSLLKGGKGEPIAPMGLVQKVEAPDDSKTLLKTVPAKVDEIVVGEALLYDDGSVEIMIDENAPKDAVDKIRAAEKQFGYSIATGGEDGPS